MSDRPPFHYGPREDSVPTPEALLGRQSLRNRNVPKSKAGGPVSVAASGTGTSVPTPPKTGPANITPPKSGGPEQAPPVADRGYGTRPKGRPQYVPQWALPDGVIGPPAPPPSKTLPSWAIVPGSQSVDAVQDHQKKSVSDLGRNVSDKVRQTGSSRSTDQANLGGSGDRVLQRLSPPVIVPGTPTQAKTSGPLFSGNRVETVGEPGSGSARSSSPPVKKMPPFLILHDLLQNATIQ